MRHPAAILAALFLIGAAREQPLTGAAALRQDIAVLADDAFAGRAPGTPGGKATMAYVIRRFAQVGLAPGASSGWSQPVTVAGMASANLIGRLTGADAAAEAVVITAHWDHLGLCRPPGSDDRICNGAVDNASGVALLIEVARQLASGPRPSRSILFVATTGEEQGLLGARALVAAPPVPLDRIVAAINLDTVATAPAGAPVGIVGRGLTRLDAIVDAEARRLHRPVSFSRWANQFVKRQDGWVFLKAGVPAIMLGGSFGDRAALGAFLKGRYHRPDDDLAHLPPLAGVAEDSLLIAAVVRAFADPDRLARSPLRPRRD